MQPIESNVINIYLDIDKTDRGVYLVKEYTEVWGSKLVWTCPTREVAEALVDERLKYWEQIVQNMVKEWKESNSGKNISRSRLGNQTDNRCLSEH